MSSRAWSCIELKPRSPLTRPACVTWLGLGKHKAIQWLCAMCAGAELARAFFTYEALVAPAMGFAPIIEGYQTVTRTKVDRMPLMSAGSDHICNQLQICGPLIYSFDSLPPIARSDRRMARGANFQAFPSPDLSARKFGADRRQVVPEFLGNCSCPASGSPP
jgi:hypothetical protein